MHKKFEPKSNNVLKGEKSKACEARKPPKDKDACFGCGEKGHMKKDCPKAVSASTPSERLKPLLGGGFVAKASLQIGCENPGSGLMMLHHPISCAVAVSRVGTKCAILLTLSMTTIMELNTLNSGRKVMKSFQTFFQHLVGMGNSLNNPTSSRK